MSEVEHITSPETSSKVLKKSAQQPAKARKKENAAESLAPGAAAEKNVQVPGWKKLAEKVDADLLLFKITPTETLKIDWESLTDNIKTAFQDVLDTVQDKGEVYDSETEGECFVFGFSDEGVHLSAVCTTLNGKVAFFYKEETV